MRDLTGQVFGRLTVLGAAYTKGGRSYWKCRCECGTEKVIARSALVSGRTRSCGCSRHDKRPYRIIDLTGQVFGKLTVIEFVARDKGATFWRCRCECGKETVVRREALQTGATTSCGSFSCGAWRARGEIDTTFIGKRFGRLVVIAFAWRDKRRMSHWLCECDCGNKKVIAHSGLTSGRTKSCGCLRKKKYIDVPPGVGLYVAPKHTSDAEHGGTDEGEKA